jgi:hypothetical protein
VREADHVYDNVLKGSAVPLVVPEWTDANDWAAACDPRVAPAIFVGERFGLAPEIFIAGDELSPAVFSNDEHRLKVRHYLAVWVNDFRPLYKITSPDSERRDDVQIENVIEFTQFWAALLVWCLWSSKPGNQTFLWMATSWQGSLPCW